jgi:hypothetical protein
MNVMQGWSYVIDFVLGLIAHPVETIVIMAIVGLIGYMLEHSAQNKKPDCTTDHDE